MKIVILTSETPSNVWLTNYLCERHDVVGIVVERRPLALTPEEKIARRQRMIERHGLLRTYNKLLYNKFRSRWVAGRDDAAARRFFFPDGAAIAYARALPTVVVDNVNDDACIEFVRSHGTEALAVCGTGVLQPKVFEIPVRGAINMHTGITPEYRSADPIFWALYCGEPDKVGVTIHFVDRGIDTGKIIHQQSVPVFADDTLGALALRCVRRGAVLFSQALTELADGTVKTIEKPGVPGRSFRSIDLGLAQYLLFRLRFMLLATRLPRRPATFPATAADPES